MIFIKNLSNEIKKEKENIETQIKILELIKKQNDAIKKISNSNAEMFRNIKINPITKFVSNIDYEKLKKEWLNEI